MKTRTALLAATLMSLSLSAVAAADIEVKDAWARATVPGQKASGAFMTLTSTKGATLTGASSPVAQFVEIHEMKHEGDVMKMRAVSKVELPAGQAVDLNGGYHIMLMGLNKELKAGDIVPLTLKVERKGKKDSVSVNADVRALSTGQSSTDEHQHHHH
jgi:copper(I)-binding protein